jgi:hypothetical protein
MSETEYAKAVAEFLAKKNVTRCPTVCVAVTRASVADADRAALRSYDETRLAARIAKQRNHLQLLAS